LHCDYIYTRISLSIQTPSHLKMVKGRNTYLYFRNYVNVICESTIVT
jgi:hypothetical protein